MQHSNKKLNKCNGMAPRGPFASICRWECLAGLRVFLAAAAEAPLEKSERMNNVMFFEIEFRWVSKTTYGCHDIRSFPFLTSCKRWFSHDLGAKFPRNWMDRCRGRHSGRWLWRPTAHRQKTFFHERSWWTASHRPKWRVDWFVFQFVTIFH